MPNPTTQTTPLGSDPLDSLLHGADGDSRYYVTPMTCSLIDEHQVIAVCADGNKRSWWIDSPVDKESKYETFVVSELVSKIDADYRTNPVRERRGIMGGSMGGHGACWIGIRHRDMFGVIGNIFGGLDLRPYAGRWGLDAVLGDKCTHSANWDAHSVVNIAPQLRNGEVALISVVGTEDFFLEPNRDFHKILSKNSVAHEYVEICGPDHMHSCHSNEFFEMVEPTVFRFLSRYFSKADRNSVSP